MKKTNQHKRSNNSRKKLKRKPTTPGEIIQEEFLTPMNLTQKMLADHIEVDVKVINRLINERTSLTPKLAVKLAATFKTAPLFWLNAQMALDLYYAEDKLTELPKPILKFNIES